MLSPFVAAKGAAARAGRIPVDTKGDHHAKKSTKKTAIPTTTLREVLERYLAHMETAGKSIGTCTSYKGELQVAMDELGAGAPAAATRPRRSKPGSSAGNL